MMIDIMETVSANGMMGKLSVPRIWKFVTMRWLTKGSCVRLDPKIIEGLRERVYLLQTFQHRKATGVMSLKSVAWNEGQLIFDSQRSVPDVYAFM